MKPHEIGYYKKLGSLETYLELLSRGIRQICIPSHGEANVEDLNYVHKEAEKKGFCTMLIIYNRIGIDGRKFKSYQRIIYRKNRRADACLLRAKMQKTTKAKSDHKIIGKLLGYGREEISSFISSR